MTFRDPPADVVAPRETYLFRDVARCGAGRPGKGCGATVYWWETASGKLSPHDADGTSHFATCPVAGQFRKEGKGR